ncbi:MAG: hypothetical protein CL750_04690, partial [Chloroflexi bacterium]|nr:hypothetical protein [Chloroflexota bacterium]
MLSKLIGRPILHIIFCGILIFISACSSADVLPDNELINQNSSAPYPFEIIAPSSDSGTPRAVPNDFESLWKAWEILNSEHIDRDTFNTD